PIEPSKRIFTVSTIRIHQANRTPPAIVVQRTTIRRPSRIRRRPPPQPRREVPRPVVVEARLVVALLARVPVPLGRDLDAALPRPVRAGAVRVVVLVADDRPGVVRLHAGRAEVVVELVAEPRHHG